MARAEAGIAAVKYGSADGLALGAAPAWPTMKRLVRESILPNWRILAGGIAAMIVMAATTGVLPFLLQKVGDDIFIIRNATVLYVLPIAVFVVMTLRAAADWAASVSDARLGTKVVADLRVRMFDAIARAGEAGSRLSGGERQRIAFARAMLRNTPILLLDEPTSALDAESEAKVQAAMERLLRGRTVVMIAHRLSTVRKADRICFMEAGRIVETGTNDELVACRGKYARMFHTQFAGDEPLRAYAGG